MCRNIKLLFNFDPPATDDEVRAAAVQFVRKVSGFTRPSQANQAAFDRAVDEVAQSAPTQLGPRGTHPPDPDPVFPPLHFGVRLPKIVFHVKLPPSTAYGEPSRVAARERPEP